MRERTAVRAVALPLVVLLAAAGCSTKRVHEEPVIDQGDRVAVDDTSRSSADARAAEEREESRDRLAELRARALEECEPEVCEAILGGRAAPGMSRAGVLAVTGTTEEAWRIRASERGATLVPRRLSDPPSDDVAPLEMVQLRDGGVVRLAYREPEGIRVVSSPEDATLEGRAAARADRLLEEGDELAAAGDLDRALDRYDRADVLRPGHPMTLYRIATVLDKQLRPIEALIQYRLFLHQLELEKIRARGEVAASIAEAIARARERVVILEKRTR